ncbi:MAG: DUF342 domain-containing protein [Lachnospiraceae bacterium]|nr:DUF342 domain-containing protein [Lachnospiraceae bacterium]
MGNRNAYFQLENCADGMYLLLYPGTDSTLLSYSEIDDYLQKARIEYDKIEVMKALNVFKEYKRIRLNSTPQSMPEKERLIVTVSPDHRTAVGRFYPAAAGGEKLTQDDIISDMVHAGVKYGVIQESIDSFLENRQYCTDYPLAKAMLPVEGSNAVITYHFNTDPSRKPKLNEDGTVDFHQIESISAIKADDCLATLTPAVMGKPGIDVTGRVIAPLKVQVKNLRAGQNQYLSEDGLKLYSKVSGHASLVDGTVFVSNVYEVKADVDTSTGDIDYDGNVTIHGSVITGYTVHAKGDIIVEGVVEGAELVAGGDIILKRGIQGMSRGRLIAAGNVVSKFIENAEVKAGGYITTEAILHSRVTATGEIVVSGKKGFITGGEIRSGASISVKTAGSPMGTATLLEIGHDPGLMEEYHRLDKELPEMEKELEKCEQVLNLLLKRMKAGETLDADKMIMMKNAKNSRDELQIKIQKTLERIEELSGDATSEAAGCLRIEGMIYPGCKVILYNNIYHVRSELKYCRLVKSGADVKMIEYL